MVKPRLTRVGSPILLIQPIRADPVMLVVVVVVVVACCLLLACAACAFWAFPGPKRGIGREQKRESLDER